MSLVDGYPQVVGCKLESIIEKAGPSHYDTIGVASPPTGGQDIEAAEFGLKYIEHVTPALSDSGEFIVYFTPTVMGAQGIEKGKLMWVTAAGGAEVAHTTDLSRDTVRLRAIGLD